MRIPRGTGVIGFVAGILIVGFSSPAFSNPMGHIQTGSGKMTVLFNGVENGTLGFGDDLWSPGETRTAKIDILNEGEIDFLSTLDSGDYPEGTMVDEFNAVVSDENGEVLFSGLYHELIVSNMDTPVGDTEHLTLDVQWMPPEDADFSKSRHGSFNMGVNAQQKIN